MSAVRLNNMVRMTLPQECVAEQFDRDHTRYYTLYIDERWLRDQIIALDEAEKDNQKVVEATTETPAQEKTDEPGSGAAAADRGDQSGTPSQDQNEGSATAES